MIGQSLGSVYLAWEALRKFTPLFFLDTSGYVFTYPLARLFGYFQSRGSTRDGTGTGVHNGNVNQLLTKIDGVEALNNVLLIGMTNRKDLLDEALLRPRRLDVHIEISLPDEIGRLQILQIHTKKIKDNSFLSHDVNLQELAARTKNYSGAELEGVVKSATSYAFNRQFYMEDLTKPVDEDNIKITMDDFLQALLEVKPAFGASSKDLELCRIGVIGLVTQTSNLMKLKTLFHRS